MYCTCQYITRKTAVAVNGVYTCFVCHVLCSERQQYACLILAAAISQQIARNLTFEYMLCDLCRSGGVQGGISNGENIVLRIAFKPTATISRNQKTVGRAGVDMELRARGRHDPCVVPRAVPMVEAMVALVLADHLLQHFAQCELLPRQDSVSPDTSIASQFKRASSALQEAASH